MLLDAYYNLGNSKSFGNYLKVFEEISIMENNINFIFKTGNVKIH